jgi:hypothetical protein
MQWTKKALILGLFLAPALSVAGKELRIPPVPCSTAWGPTPEDYLYNHSIDGNYETYLQRLGHNRTERLSCRKAWTLLVYMSVTSDLAPYAVADQLEMELPTAGSGVRTDIIVQVNNIRSRQSQRLHMFKNANATEKPLTKKEVLQLLENQIFSPIVSRFPKDMSESEGDRLKAFIKWGMENYPAEHYGLVIWGHGQAWKGVDTNSDSGVKRRFGKAAVITQKELDLPNIRDVLKTTKKLRSTPIELLITDTCLMHSMEDMTELSKYIQYGCGSPGIQSSAGNQYGDLICRLNNKDYCDVKNTLLSHMEKSGIASEDTDFSEPHLVSALVPFLYKLSFDPKTGSQTHIDPLACEDLIECTVSAKHLYWSLVPSLNDLGNALIRYIKENPDLEQDRWMDVRLAMKKEKDPFPGGTQDLGGFLKHLNTLIFEKSEEAPSPARDSLKKALVTSRDALNYTVVLAVFGTKYPQFDTSTEFGPRGLAIWLPQTYQDYRAQIADISNSKLYLSGMDEQNPGWAKWMELMYPDPAIQPWMIQ